MPPSNPQYITSYVKDHKNWGVSRSPPPPPHTLSTPMHGLLEDLVLLQLFYGRPSHATYIMHLNKQGAPVMLHIVHLNKQGAPVMLHI